MIDLAEFQRRVEQYFQCGQRNEPGGRIILDLLGALRVECARNEQLRAKLIEGGPEDDWEERGAAAELRAENERLTELVERLRAEIELVSK